MWLAAALVLGGVALLVLYKPAGGGGSSGIVPPGSPVLSFDPAAVRSMTVTTPDGRKDTIIRAEGESWSLVIGSTTANPSAAAAAPWPVAPSRAGPIVRLLSEMRAAAEPDPKAEVGESPTVVRLALSDRTARQLTFSDRTLGGTVLVLATTVPSPTSGAGSEETTMRAMVTANVLNALRNPGPRGWRETAAVPDAGPDVSRIILQSDQRTITLARLQGKWHLRQPVSAPARADRVAGVLGALARVTITDFLDDRSPTAPLTGLDAPALKITLETDKPGAAAGSPTQTARVELSVGGPSDSTGKHLFAKIRDGNGPERIVAVDALQLSQTLSADPVAYISPTVTQVDPADAGMVILSAAPPPAAGAKGPPTPSPTDRRLKRHLGNWSDVMADGKESMLAEADASSVNEFLAMLGAKPATSVVLTVPPGCVRIGYLSLATLDGGPLDVIEIGIISGGVVFKSGDVYRTQPSDSLQRFFREWLARAGGLTTPASPAAPAGPVVPPDVVK